MKLIFISNFLNHHTLPICDEFYKNFETFYFVSTSSQDGIDFRDELERQYVLHTSIYTEELQANKVIKEADVVIFGAGSDRYIYDRMKYNKLSFIYSERLFKKGKWRRFIPTTWYKLFKRIIKYHNKNLYYLCASAYLSYDLSLLRIPVEKCFQWGYFPYTKKYESIKEIQKIKDKKLILWVGRLIPLKHPELSIELMKRLIESHNYVHLNIIGSGEMETDLINMVHNYKLNEYVSFLGPLKTEIVRLYMEQASILIFTSDRNEGWGAVINEAMNSGCVVVGSNIAGAVPFLINNGVNGMIFKNGDIENLYSIVNKLINNIEFQTKLGIQAYNDIIEIWNASTAVNRFEKLCNGLINNKRIVFKSGPCSIANIIKDL